MPALLGSFSHTPCPLDGWAGKHSFPACRCQGDLSGSLTSTSLDCRLRGLPWLSACRMGTYLGMGGSPWSQWVCGTETPGQGSTTPCITCMCPDRALVDYQKGTETYKFYRTIGKEIPMFGGLDGAYLISDLPNCLETIPSKCTQRINTSLDSS